MLTIDNDVSFPDEPVNNELVKPVEVTKADKPPAASSAHKRKVPQSIFRPPMRPSPYKWIAPYRGAKITPPNNNRPPKKTTTQPPPSTSRPNRPNLVRPPKAETPIATPVLLPQLAPPSTSPWPAPAPFKDQASTSRAEITEDSPGRRTWTDQASGKFTVIFNPTLPPPPSLESVLLTRPSSKGDWRRGLPKLDEPFKVVHAYGLTIPVPLYAIQKFRRWKWWHRSGKVILKFDRFGECRERILDFSKPPRFLH